MRSIGGYFELELNNNSEYHKNAILLNSGRFALEYILKANKIKKLYTPVYICDAIIEKIKNCNVKMSFYNINERFEPVYNFNSIKKNESLLVINYFGICDNIVQRLSKLSDNLIIDNCQAFYSKPLENLNTFYSPRKFFGVPDGAYLYSKKYLKNDLKKDFSSERSLHLLYRLEKSPEIGFKIFKRNEKIISGSSMSYMSDITRKILLNINYKKIAKIRRENFKYLHSKLARVNKLNIRLSNHSVPLVYPFYSDIKHLRERLISNKIYIAKYWPNVDKSTAKNSIELELSNNLFPLPIDQRYSKPEMDKILNILDIK